MYSITWIENGSLHSISTPSLTTATRTFYNIRIRARQTCRLWACFVKGQPLLVF